MKIHSSHTLTFKEKLGSLLTDLISAKSTSTEYYSESESQSRVLILNVIFSQLIYAQTILTSAAGGHDKRVTKNVVQLEKKKYSKSSASNENLILCILTGTVERS